MEILGFKIGRSEQEKAADQALISVKAEIANRGWELREALQASVPHLEVDLMFEPQSDMKGGGWVKRTFEVSDADFLNRVVVRSLPSEHNRVRRLSYNTQVEGQDFSFNVAIYLDETGATNRYYVGKWTIGFKGSEISSETATTGQIASLKGLTSIADTLVAQTHLWQARNELHHAEDVLDRTEFGAEAKAVAEVANVK